MLKFELHNHDTTGDPAARFASDIEIEYADQLRHQLEEQYLARSSQSLPWQLRSSEGH